MGRFLCVYVRAFVHVNVCARTHSDKINAGYWFMHTRVLITNRSNFALALHTVQKQLGLNITILLSDVLSHPAVSAQRM